MRNHPLGGGGGVANPFPSPSSWDSGPCVIVKSPGSELQPVGHVGGRHLDYHATCWSPALNFCGQWLLAAARVITPET